MKFWKVGSRRIFAVVESELDRLQKGKGKRKRREVIRIEDSDSDDNTSTYLAEKRFNQEEELVTEVKAIRRDLGAVLSLTKDMKLPPGLFKQLTDTFKWTICQSTPMTPPYSLGVVRPSWGVKIVWMAGLLERMEGPRVVPYAELKGIFRNMPSAWSR